MCEFYFILFLSLLYYLISIKSQTFIQILKYNCIGLFVFKQKNNKFLFFIQCLEYKATLRSILHLWDIYNIFQSIFLLFKGAYIPLVVFFPGFTFISRIFFSSSHHFHWIDYQDRIMTSTHKPPIPRSSKSSSTVGKLLALAKVCWSTAKTCWFVYSLTFVS